MAKSGSIIGQITEELGELGKKVVTETAKAPVDIVTGAFEKKPSDKTPSQPDQKNRKEHSMQKEEPITPRKMLEHYARKEPSVYEKKMREEHEKKETVKKQAVVAAWQNLPNTGHAAKRGDPRNIAKKQAGSETSRDMRSG